MVWPMPYMWSMRPNTSTCPLPCYLCFPHRDTLFAQASSVKLSSKPSHTLCIREWQCSPCGVPPAAGGSSPPLLALLPPALQGTPDGEHAASRLTRRLLLLPSSAALSGTPLNEALLLPLLPRKPAATLFASAMAETVLGLLASFNEARRLALRLLLPLPYQPLPPAAPPPSTLAAPARMLLPVRDAWRLGLLQPTAGRGEGEGVTVPPSAVAGRPALLVLLPLTTQNGPAAAAALGSAPPE